MATTQTQLRRGTNAQVNAMTPAEGEVVVDMTNDRLCLGDGTRQGGFPIPNFSDIQKNVFGYGVAGGTSDAITLALSPALLSYVEGVSFSFRATTTNTGSATINVSGLGAIGIRQQDLSTLPAGAITSGRNYELTYNGTYFVLAGQVGQQQRQYERVSISGISGTSFKLAEVPAWANTININMNTVTGSGNNVTVGLRLGIGGATGVTSGYSGSYVRHVSATSGATAGTVTTSISASFVLRDSPNGNYLHLIKLTRGVDSTQWSAEWVTPNDSGTTNVTQWIGAGRITLASALTDLFVARTPTGSLTGGQALITFEE